MANSKVKIIKDTILNSLLSEMEVELKEKVSDQDKRNELFKLINSKLVEILGSMDEKELLPMHEPKSQQEFENHLHTLLQKVKKRLLADMRKEVE